MPKLLNERPPKPTKLTVEPTTKVIKEWNEEKIEYVKYPDGTYVIKPFDGQRLENKELIPFIEKHFTFHKLTKHDQMPNDLVYDGITPFHEWQYEYDSYAPIRDDFTSSMWNEEKDSILNNPGKDIKIFVTKDMNNHTITIEYKGPKHLIETDKDYYIGEVKNINKEYHDDVSKSKTYYFHFNPVQTTLKIYKDKINYNENYKK